MSAALMTHHNSGGFKIFKLVTILHFPPLVENSYSFPGLSVFLTPQAVLL